MKLLTCIVTHDRIGYSQRCIESWRTTADKTDQLAIVDNCSDDGTPQWLKQRVKHWAMLICNDANVFPGAACNQGWAAGLERWPDTTHLHRSDNDIEYRPGWRQEIDLAYSRHPRLVLLGLLNLHEDRGVEHPPGEPGDVDEPGAVGGNVVMPRGLWEGGLRWSEQPWHPGANEDAHLSSAAHRHGQVAQLRRTVADNMAFGRYSDYPSYYDRTAALRGLNAATSV